jgi:TPR repeat protein
VKLNRLVADQGFAEAQSNLGVMYYNLDVLYDFGEGVAQDKAKALKWYSLAAEHGYVEAQFTLARFYYNGDVVAQDKAKAAKLYGLAAEQGHAKNPILSW